jgi:hypothetical protein
VRGRADKSADGGQPELRLSLGLQGRRPELKADLPPVDNR